MSQLVTVRLDEIPEPGAKGFSYTTATGEQEGFVVRFAGEVRAYENSCPHTGVSLNWSDDQFFELDHKFIQCALHGALFQPQDGRCIWGPCLGQSLKSLPFELVEQNVLIYI